MAFSTIVWNGRGVIANCDGLSDSIGGTWAELGGGGISYNTDSYLTGAGSIGHVYASKSGFGYYTTATNYDFSTGGAEEGQFIYIWINISSSSAFDILANNGFSFVVGTDTSNYRTFKLAGSDDNNGWSTGWKLFVFDPSIAGSIADTGTFDLATINMIGLWMDTIVSVRADTIFIDQVAIAKGLRVADGVGSISDIVTYCAKTLATRAWGVFQYKGRFFYSAGGLTVGDNVSQTENTTLTSDGDIIGYETSEFYHDTNGWSLTHPIDYNKLTLEKHASYATAYNAINTNLYGHTDARIQMTGESGVTLDFAGGAFEELNDTSMSSGGVIENAVISKSGARSVNSAKYNYNTTILSETITVDGTGEFTGNKIQLSISAMSTLCSNLEHLEDTSFLSDGSNHATELTSIDTGSMTWSCTSSGYDAGVSGSPVTPTNTGNEDIYISATTGEVTINVASGATTPSIRSAGAVVNVVAGQITLTLTGLPDDIEVRIRQGSHTLQHNQNVSGGQETYTYSYVQDELVTIGFGGAGIIEAKTIQLLLGNANQTSLITFVNDPSYGGTGSFVCSFSDIVDIYDEAVHTVTMTFTRPPKASTMITDNITQLVESNGTISNIVATASPLIWTFDYTANTAITDLTNYFTISTGVTDEDDIPLEGNVDSDNFTITNDTFGVIFSGVANIADELPHTITMTFTRIPKSNTMIVANITQQVEDNGTISDIGVTANPLIWEFDYTADADVTDTTNFYRATTGITDLIDTALVETDSSNFEIDNASFSIDYTNASDEFVYGVDASDNAILVNQGTGGTADALLKTGRAIELGATNDLPIPVYYTLGSETIGDYNKITQTGCTYTDSGTGQLKTFDITGAGSTFVVQFDFITTPTIGDTYLIDLDITLNSGALSILYLGYGDTVDITPAIVLSSGSNIITIIHTVGANTYGLFNIYTNATVSNFTTTVIGVKELTNPNSYITYHDIGTNIITQIDNSVNDGITHYSLNTLTVNNILTHDTEIDATSIANIEANPNLLGELGVNGSASGINITLDASDDYYMCAEPDSSTVYSARTATTATVDDYSSEDIRLNADYNEVGIQTTAFELDANGKPTAYTYTYLVQNAKQTITLPLDTPLDYTPTKDIKAIEGDSTELTITHVDNSTDIVP